MRKWLCIGLSLLFLLTTGCALMPHDEEGGAPLTTTITTTVTTTATTTTVSTTSTTTTVSTTTTAPAFITEEQAVTIAEQYWGIQNGDVAPETGFMMTISPLELPTADNPIYRIALRWLVEVDGQASHFSMVDSIRIDAVSGEVLPITLYPEQ